MHDDLRSCVPVENVAIFVVRKTEYVEPLQNIADTAEDRRRNFG